MNFWLHAIHMYNMMYSIVVCLHRTCRWRFTCVRSGLTRASVTSTTPTSHVWVTWPSTTSCTTESGFPICSSRTRSQRMLTRSPFPAACCVSFRMVEFSTVLGEISICSHIQTGLSTCPALCGHVWSCSSYSMTVGCHMSLEKFPFDEQMCTLKMESCEYMHGWHACSLLWS